MQPSPILTASEEPLMQDDVMVSGPEALRCIWCQCLDGPSMCATCGRILCPECLENHVCDEFKDKLAAMYIANAVLTFNTDFEVLRCLRTCRKIGFRLAASLRSGQLLKQPTKFQATSDTREMISKNGPSNTEQPNCFIVSGSRFRHPPLSYRGVWW